MTGMRRTFVSLSAAGLLSLSLMFAAGCNKDANSSGPAPSGGPPTSAGSGGSGGGPGAPGGGGAVDASATGAEIMQKKCGCHGPGGKGGKAPVLAGTSKSEDELTKIIHDGKGKGKMPAFASQLTDDQIKKVVAEIKSLK